VPQSSEIARSPFFKSFATFITVSFPQLSPWVVISPILSLMSQYRNGFDGGCLRRPCKNDCETKKQA